MNNFIDMFLVILMIGFYTLFIYGMLEESGRLSFMFFGAIGFITTISIKLAIFILEVIM